MKKTKILTFVYYYLPGYKSGGPVRTIANMVDRLSEYFDFYIVTSDRDSFDTKPYEGIEVNTWNRVGNSMVYYASPEKRSLFSFRRLMRQMDYDIVYLNSFFNPVFTLYPLLLRFLKLIPDKVIILAPRGEFSPGALEIKPTKKQLYIALCRFLRLTKNIVWQASSELEADNIKRVMGKKNTIRIAPNLPATTMHSDSQPEIEEQLNGDTLKICFLSRISPMKNLDYAVRVLSRLRIPVQFDIFGLVSTPEYWKEVQDIIRSLPQNVHADYRGIARHEDVHHILKQYDLFFLPTRGENYGHAILEALAAGTPVIISDQTPWRDLEEKGVGWALSLDDMEAFVRTIEAFYEAAYQEKMKMRKAALEFAFAVSQSDKNVELNRSLFLQAISLLGENQ